VLGPEPGRYRVEDWQTGRGLFLAGVNVTPIYARFVGELPAGVRPRLSWVGGEFQVALPGLLGDGEEVWVTRVFEFLDEVAVRL